VSRTIAPQEKRSAVQNKVPALTKTIAIIRYLNDLSAAGASLQEIAERLRITKSHCHNILKTLTREGWLTYDDKRRSYALAPRLLTDVGCLFRARRTPHILIHEELMRLSWATGTPCVLSRVERDGSFVAIDKAEETAELTVSVPIGHRFPADAPAQMRVRLAWMAEDPRRRELARWRPHRYTHSNHHCAQKSRMGRNRGHATTRLRHQPRRVLPRSHDFGRAHFRWFRQCADGSAVSRSDRQSHPGRDGNRS